MDDLWHSTGHADPSALLTPYEPPPAPGHVLSTDQRYTVELHTTHPAGYAHTHWPAAAGELHMTTNTVAPVPAWLGAYEASLLVRLLCQAKYVS